MNDELILQDAAYIKLRNGEPMSLIDFQRIVQLISNAPFTIHPQTEGDVAKVQSELIQTLQGKFMQGQQQL